VGVAICVCCAETANESAKTRPAKPRDRPFIANSPALIEFGQYYADLKESALNSFMVGDSSEMSDPDAALDQGFYI